MPDGQNNVDPATRATCRAAALLPRVQTLNNLDFGPYHGTEAKKQKSDRLPERKAFDFPAVKWPAR
jgi:hypothetical protein